LFDPGTFHCSGSCLTFTDSTLVAHHVAGLTGLQSNKRYWVINEATSAHGTTRSTYAYSFKTKPGSVGSIPPRIYLSDPEGGSNDRVMIIDPVTNTQILPSIVVTGNNPTELASHPDASAVYVMAGKNLSVIDVPTNSEFASLSGAGDSSNHLAVSSDGHRLYLVYRDLLNSTLKIKVYDTTDSHSPSLVTTISDPVFNGCAAPLGIVVSPDGSQVYTACRPTVSSSPDQFYMVDTASNTPTITATFTRDSTNNTSINAMAITPDGSEVFVARDDGSGGGHATVEVFDGGTGSNIGSIILPASALPRAGVVSPDGSTLYVADQVLGTHIIDAVANTYVSTMTMATSRGFDIGITPDGTRLYTSLLFDVFVNDSDGNPVTTITGSFNDAMQLTVTPGIAAPPSPDVLMTDVTPNAATVSAGETLSVTDSVKNQGTASTDSSFFIGYSLSPNTTYGDGDDVAITTTRVVGPLAVGLTDTATTSLLIPSTTPPGTYHLCATADSTAALAESNVDNNPLCSTVTVDVVRPDLVMTAVTPNSGSFVPGGTLSVTDTVQNQGGAPTVGNFTIAYSLSSNTTYGDGDDVAITTTRVVGVLAAGASNTATTNLLIPSSTPPGTYYVCANADSGSAVSESNETNNSLCSTLTVGPATPDLIMSAVSTAATGVAPGGSFTLSNSAKNQGSASAGSFTIAFHLSTNATYGDGDDVTITATRTVSSLAAGATSTASTSLVVPAATPLGTYYVCATADSANSVLEGDETNNARCTTTTIQVTRPDLIMTAVTPNSGTVSPTATLSVTDSAKNQGAVTAGSSKVGYSLSTNTTYGDGDDIAITTTRTISTLAAGATSTATTTLAIPNTTPPGNYYVCAKADSANTVTELDETNNTLCSAATVSVPQSDLITSAVSTTATVLAPGGSLTLSNSVQNPGAFPAGSFTIAFSLSTNTTYGDGDDIAFSTTRTVNSLASGATSTATTALTIPTATPLGTYYVCVMADSGNSVTESNESNNSLCTSTTIQVTRPDLVETAVTPNAGTVNQGATLSVSDTVMNQGALSTGAGFRVGFHLSTNTTYGDGDDVTITTARVVGALAAGASSSGTTNLAIAATTPPGVYYVCAMADSLGQVTESNETNNTLCSSTTVTVPPPDLITTAVSTSATTVAKGANFSLSNTVKNQGGSKAGSFAIGFHLSTNTTFGDGDDVAITQTRSVGSLAIGATSAGTTTLTVPGLTPSGTYYVCAMADVNNTVTEGDETNNSLCTISTIIVP
ncbi:MAG TPA: CARDB domain-containing protein, partial [Nitrospiria bacterium]|nr:CARDB domain-containing protein [Nitrospiria bacterium]